ncbi:excinuclease ABC subunit UvrA [Sporolactobacillus shoreicorticis]|uniref:UvrABC system protein A n=1 Tax=Sporolactobacillus shoreicorticis TaxID=1923877 RepID=A0ABW5S8I7_9BACL|nr:excinuclease ABC subunit UvrA [Sporolactobacillus shoreicorticis]MCO7126914.1 excinuclease ABC subunit UvrA [Sporolactobacillus shoreicorticis]
MRSRRDVIRCPLRLLMHLRKENLPQTINIDHACTHNLKDVTVQIPLRQQVVIAGVSGSGKSSLAMGVLYAEGSRRYLEGLSAFTRRKLHQMERADAEKIEFLPPALALRQRPPLLGRRSTVGTITEIYNLLRLMFSRLGTHQCPNGHRVPPSLTAILNEACVCPECSASFPLPSAEAFSFNSALGACPVCGGLGERAEVDPALVIADANKTIRQGAVASWRAAGRGYTVRLVAQLGVRIDVPWRELSDKEREIVLHGKQTKRPLTFHNRETGEEYPITFTYDNAVEAVRQLLAGDRNQTRYARMKKFLSVRRCDHCHGIRLRPEALLTRLCGLSIAEAAALTIDELKNFTDDLSNYLEASLQPVAKKLAEEMRREIAPILELEIGYLTLDRSGATLSTGERQRLELLNMSKSHSTGILYVLDEPSVGLHPANVAGLQRVMRRMVTNGNSLVVVDHNLEIIRGADYMIEMGPQAGEQGGQVVAEGTPNQVAHMPDSLTGNYLSGRRVVHGRKRRSIKRNQSFVEISVHDLHNLHDVTARFPLNRMTAVTGVSGAGKTAMVQGALVPAIRAHLNKTDLPISVSHLAGATEIRRILIVDAAPIGRNARSTPATYTGIFDLIRALYAKAAAEAGKKWAAGYFSFNVKGGRCPVCEGRGEMALDMQYLPEQRVCCPHCGGTRYEQETLTVKIHGKSIADVLAMNIDEAAAFFANVPELAEPLRLLQSVGLGYLRLGESTPGLSGGEAQRMKLAGELQKHHPGTLYVLDEPSTGLHPQNIETLLGVLDRLMAEDSTVILIDHDPDLIANCDYVVDLGPGGGPFGGKIVAEGTPEQVAKNSQSLTGRYLMNRIRTGSK